MSSRIPINLAAQPVERTRAIRRVLGLLGLGLAVVTVLHAGLFLWVTREQGDIDVAPRPAVAPEQLDAWRAEVDRLATVADVDRARLAAGAVGLGNELINWRTIPWRSIFADLEEVLPRRVRLEVVAPGIGAEESLEVQLTAAARDTGPLQDLMLALEAHPAFADVWPTREDAGVDEFVRLTLRARYVPQPAVEAVP